MAEEKKILIPGRLKNAAVGGHVAGTEDIYDDGLSKTQQEINVEHEAALNTPSTGVIARLETLEGEVAFSGDFEAENNPSGIVSGGEKITTTNAVNGALDYAGYFECSSNADAVTKAVLNTGYALRNGGCIKIKMTNANTANNAKLKLGNADAKDLYYDGSRVGSGNSWEAGEVIEVYYDGTAFYANNVAGGSGDGAFDISKYKALNGTPATYRTLTEALGTNGANVPSNKRKGGMTIKYIQLTDATYSLVKTEGLDTQPTGVELQSAISITDGVYTGSQLPQNIALPQNIGASTTYYLAVTQTVDEQEVTTYTMWVVTKLTNDVTEYVQWMLKNTTWSILQSDWIGKDATPTEGSTNWVTSGGIWSEIDKSYDYVETPYKIASNLWINDGVLATSSTQTCRYISVKAGDYIKISALSSQPINWRIGFCTELPAENVQIVDLTSLTNLSSVNQIFISNIEGYIVFNHSKSYIEEETLFKRQQKYVNALVKLANKESLSTVTDIVSLVSGFENIIGTDTGYSTININGNMSTSSTTNAVLYSYPVNENKYYKIVGRVGGASNNLVGYAFFNNNNELISYGERSSLEGGRNFDDLVLSPEGAVTVYVDGNPDFVLPSVKLMVQAATDEQKEEVRERLGIYGMEIKTIRPSMTRDYLNIAGGIGHGGTVIDVRCVVSTVRFIKVSGDISINSEYSRFIRVQKFDKDFNFIGYQDTSVIANEILNLNVGNARYVKIMLAADNNFNVQIPMQNIGIIGTFGNDWDVFNTRPSDGYQRIAVAVRVTEPSSCEQETDAVQDNGTIECDYGVLALPERYQPVGLATRLIIYCHGAAVNYVSSVTRFDTQDLEPEYWLAEGYAVMDIEGNPFDNTNEHFFIPMAMESYIAAYNWVINHFNIKRDGVFLGGRSMGGGMTFNILRNECPIPVIAACPNVPASTPNFYWNYMNSARRTFCAQHFGLIGDGVTFSGDSPMPASEWQLLKDNFDKIVKYSPIWNIITDLPGKDVLLADNMNIDRNSSYNAYESELYSNLHAKVKAPVKIFGVKDDTTCYYRRTSVLLYNLLLNGGNLVELRLFQTGGHHADTQNPNMRASVTTKFGETLDNVPVVYIEMLKFWRRFEQ